MRRGTNSKLKVITLPPSSVYSLLNPTSSRLSNKPINFMLPKFKTKYQSTYTESFRLVFEKGVTNLKVELKYESSTESSSLPLRVVK